MKENRKSSAFALFPFLLFIAIYLGAGIILNSQGVDMAFYQFPAPTALLLAIIVAFLVFKGSIEDKCKTFCEGVGGEDITIMCMIYLLAGAFATVAKTMGGVDSVVNLGLSVLPTSVVTAGLFLIACFMSLATGTSMGTLSALAPIGIGVVEVTGLSLPLMMGAIIGGSMFGDNLSFISDTTIAAARGQNVEMKDKFRLNFLIALPAAVLTIVMLAIFGRPDTALSMGDLSYNLLKVVPYLAVLVLAVIGMDVMLVMALGIGIAGVVGVATGSITIIEFAENIWSGITGMDQSFYLAFLIGGMTMMIKEQGGLDWLVQKLQKFMKSNVSAQFGIAALVGVLDAATTNNTVAIIIANPIAKDVSKEYQIDPRRTASLLDLWSCVVQGILPHGGQTLLACTLAATYGFNITPVQIIPYLWYCMLLGVFAILSTFIPFADGACRKDPWNWEYDCAESKVAEKKAALGK